MPPDAEQVDEIKKFLATARKVDMNFGLCLGKKPDGMIFVAHRKKAADILGKQARKAGETAKLAIGTMSVSGSVLQLTCQGDPPAGCAKKTKEFLNKTIGLSLKVVLLDPSGQVLEGDDDEAVSDPVSDETAPPAQAPTDDADQARLAALKGELGALQQQIKALPKDAAARMVKPFQTLVGALKASEFDRVEAGIEKLKTALDSLERTQTQSEPDSGPEGPSEDNKKLLAVHTQLGAQVDLLADPRNRTALTRALDKAREAIGAGNAKAAGAMLAKINTAIKSVSEPEPAASGNPLETWRDAKDAANEQISKLQSAMRGAKHPVLDQLADKGFNGITGQLQVGLQVALMNLDQADAAAKGAARGRARKAVADFQAFLKSDPVLPILEDNPLKVTVTLRSGLGRALGSIDAALAAQT